MPGPYDWEQDPGCSWLRHPAGTRRRLPVHVPNEESMAPAWWYMAVGAAMVLTVLAAGRWL